MARVEAPISLDKLGDKVMDLIDEGVVTKNEGAEIIYFSYFKLPPEDQERFTFKDDDRVEISLDRQTLVYSRNDLEPK